MKQQSSNHILIVDDKPENLLVLESLLEDMDCNVIKASSGNEALGLMLDYDFALVLLDVQMPEMDGFETAELMKGNELTRYIPIIFVTAISKEEFSIFKGYEIGAVDYLSKPIEPVIFKSKVKVFLELYSQKKLLEHQSELLQLKIKELTELQDANCKLENLSLSDGLTGIANRRNLDQYIKMCWENAIRSKKPLSLIMGDIDFFKQYNDNYGHLKGDECLIKVAGDLALNIKRPMDFVARYGGEEFIVILPDTGAQGAMFMAENLRKSIENLGIPHGYSPISEHITMSFGVVTTCPEHGDLLEDFIHQVDRALYAAKGSGRNKVSQI